MNRITEYTMTYQGRELGLTFNSRADVDEYVRRAVTVAGNDAADYAVQHRSVTYGDWAPTTPVRIGTPDTAPLLNGDRPVVDVELPGIPEQRVVVINGVSKRGGTYGVWARGVDIDDAEAEFKRQGGGLMHAHTVVTFDSEPAVLKVGPFGIEWQADNEPVVVQVPSRKAARR